MSRYGISSFASALPVAMLLLSPATTAQTPPGPDTVKKAVVDTLTTNTARDTIITGIQDYRNGAGTWYYLPAAGTNGLPIRAPETYYERQSVLRTGTDAFGLYEIAAATPDTFQVLRLSRMKYVVGAKKEQDFTITHRQPVSRRFSFDVLFRTMNAGGYYKRQKASFRNFRLYGDYKSTNGTWQARAGYLSNRLEAEENGGLINDSAFEQTTPDSRTLDFYFADAVNERKNKGFFMRHRIALQPAPGHDSLPEEGPRLYLLHNATYELRNRHFRSGSAYPDFFENAYYDTTATHDSIRVRDAAATLGLEITGLPFVEKLFGARVTAYAGAEMQRFDFLQRGDDTTLYDYGGELSLHLGFGSQGSLKLEFHLNQLNAAAADHRLDLVAEKRLNGKLSGWIQGFLERKKPDFVYSYYDSNHFRWIRQHLDENRAGASGGAELMTGRHALSITAGYVSVGEYVYFDHNALPAQYTTTLGRADATLEHKVALGPVSVLNRFSLFRSSRSEVLPVPDWSWYGRVSIERNLFRSALTLQAGVAGRYVSEYFAEAYMPATGQFFLQDEKKTGGYPFIDIFVNFRIKSTRFFVMMEHLNAGWTGHTYYLIPHYPFPGRVLKWGIIWDFWD